MRHTGRMLNMKFKEITYESLINGGVSQKLADLIVNPTKYDDDLNIILERLSSNWDYTIPDDATDALPLYCSNGEMCVRWIRNSEMQIAWVYHDDPNPMLVGKSENDLIGYILEQYINMRVGDDSTDVDRGVKLIGNAVDFPNVDDYLEDNGE